MADSYLKRARQSASVCEKSGTLLCAQILSGGTGLNIQSASVVIICEPQLKPSVENQAISRAYRMGQARNVLVYRLLCEDTVDERICEMLDKKQRRFDAFADKSVAASKTNEIDDKTFGKIIEAEIEKIKKEKADSSNHSTPKDVTAKRADFNTENMGETVRSDTAKNGTYIFTDTEYIFTSSEKYDREMQMSYKEFADYLKNKYGAVTGDYFLTESCASPNKRIKRTDEGLQIHHIDEDKAIQLSSKDRALSNPYDYQKADRPVYCNILEHFLLHIKIYTEPRHPNANKDEISGFGGIVNTIGPQTNGIFDGCDFVQEFRIHLKNVVKDNFEDYIKTLKYVQRNLGIDTLTLSLDFNGNVVDKVYNALK